MTLTASPCARSGLADSEGSFLPLSYTLNNVCFNISLSLSRSAQTGLVNVMAAQAKSAEEAAKAKANPQVPLSAVCLCLCYASSLFFYLLRCVISAVSYALAQEVLLAWFNEQLRKGGSNRVIKNLSSDISVRLFLFEAHLQP